MKLLEEEALQFIDLIFKEYKSKLPKGKSQLIRQIFSKHKAVEQNTKFLYILIKELDLDFSIRHTPSLSFCFNTQKYGQISYYPLTDFFKSNTLKVVKGTGVTKLLKYLMVCQREKTKKKLMPSDGKKLKVLKKKA